MSDHYKNLLDMLKKHHQGLGEILDKAGEVDTTRQGAGGDDEDTQDNDEEKVNESKDHAPSRSLSIPSIERPTGANETPDADEKEDKMRQWFKNGR